MKKPIAGLAVAILLVFPIIAYSQPYNGQYVQGGTYTKSGIFGAKCDPGDTKIRAWGTGRGRNWGWEETADGCVAWEGSNNRGVPGCAVECRKEDQMLGCFNNNDQPANLGTIPKNISFKYYPSATSDKNLAGTDPDTNTEACSCINGGIAGSGQCCGDDAQEQFCVGQAEGCFNSNYYTNADMNQYVCESCTLGKWADGKCCGDDAQEQFCVGQGAEAQGCFNAQYFSDPDNSQYVCESCAGSKWLNGKCCGDDGNADTWGSGEGASCFHGKVLPSCAPSDDESALNEDGKLLLCNQDFQYPESTSETMCSLRCSNSYFCSSTGKWKDTGGQLRNTQSTWPLDAAVKTECCTSDRCWNGSGCISNQASAPLSRDYSGYRCIAGAWKSANEVCSPEGCEVKGYCPEQTQCLYSINGNAADNGNIEGDPQCISSGQYIKDNYCELGNWTSRTKFLALKMLGLVDEGQDYTIFCDSTDKSLNYVQYAIGQESAQNIIAGANNFCILQYGGKIVFGTTLNKKIDEGDSPFIKALQTSGVQMGSCNTDNEWEFEECPGSARKIWYNGGLKAVIYSKDEIELAEADLGQRFLNFLKNPFKAIISVLQQKVETPPVDNSYLKALGKFDKLYIKVKGSSEIRGDVEGFQFKNMVIEYRNFNTDICGFVSNFGQRSESTNSGIICRKEGNNYYVLAQGSKFTAIDPDELWAGLTSSLNLG